MLEFEDALEQILSEIPPPELEQVPLAEAGGRILIEPFVAAADLPGFDNSAMDGYAVRAADVVQAKPDLPVQLQLSGRVAAGESFSEHVRAGCCVRLFTGSPLPPGADAVVMQEDTRTDPAVSGQVQFLQPVPPGENVRFRGEDVQRGKVLIKAGARITAGRLALLAAQGVAQVKVGRVPTVGLLATGSELLEPGQGPLPGHIYESNRCTLGALLRQTGARPEIYPLVPDSLEATRAALTQAMDRCDVVVSSGGVSVGEMDFVKSAFEQNGGDLRFWKVAIKPGRPLVFGVRGKKLLFGLPGNPVSAFVTCVLLVLPALRRWQGETNVAATRVPAVLAERIENPGGRRHFMRIHLDDLGNVRSAGTQASHALSSLATANALLDVPPHAALAEGTSVMVMPF